VLVVVVPLSTVAASSPKTFTLTGRQAAEVSVVSGFLGAFNRRQLQRSLAYLSVDPTVSDCDYRQVRAVQVSGTRSVERWLKQRFADRDYLQVGRVYNENPEMPTGVLGVEFSRRTSKTLRALGFPNGIKPQLSAKVRITRGGIPRIAVFANGPVGGSQESCRPK
jgi:hypothetical protein